VDPEQVEEIKRHFGVVADSFQTKIRPGAKGHDVIRYELAEFRQETQEEFKKVKALVRLSCADLNQCLCSMESEGSTLQIRLEP